MINKTILSLSAQKAQDFFFKEENYSNITLPEYFTFNKTITQVRKKMQGSRLSNFCDDKPRNYDVNYKIIANKDGRYAWRPFQLIHPAIYVEMVNMITEKTNWKIITNRFKEFQKNPKIQCASVPVYIKNNNKTQKANQIASWWHEVEQASLEKALDFSYLYTTDITDCYGSIYTHSVSWAIHERTFIKAGNNRCDPNLIGNILDNNLQNMSNGQTNGIPQGSVLMDFIAEMVLGYADIKLSIKINNAKIKNYHIIRYRDDYRIFVNNQTEGDIIVKFLTETLIDLGLKLNLSKTASTSNLILGSIKKDKLNLITSAMEAHVCNKKGNKDINNQKLLLHIYDFADKNPNSGQLKKLLSIFYENLKVDCERDNLSVLISIVVDLAYNNPSTYSFCVAIISKILICVSNNNEKIKFIKRINEKFKKLPNTGFMDIWLQRISLKIDLDMEYSDKLCKVVQNDNIPLWDSTWLNNSLKHLIDDCKLINKKKINKLSSIITQNEIDVFKIKYDGY